MCRKKDVPNFETVHCSKLCLTVDVSEQYSVEIFEPMSFQWYEQYEKYGQRAPALHRAENVIMLRGKKQYLEEQNLHF